MKHDALIAQDGLPPKLRFWAVVTVGLAIFMTVIDQMIVNVALPTIGAELHEPPSATVWIVNAYQVAIMLPLLPLASAGDIFGYRRVYLAGLALFGLASLGCALASSIEMLVLMRVIQGLGAAGVMSVNMALVRFIHPINRLGYGIGINAVIIAVSAAAGPTLASFILAIGSWPWLFAVKVPIAFLAFGVGLYVLPKTPRASHPFDVVSGLLSAVASFSSAARLRCPYRFCRSTSCACRSSRFPWAPRSVRFCRRRSPSSRSRSTCRRSAIPRSTRDS